MKRTLELLAVCALLLVSASCFNDKSKGNHEAAQNAGNGNDNMEAVEGVKNSNDPNVRELKKGVEAINSMCPIEYGLGLSCVGARMEDGYVVMSYVSDEKLMPVEEMNARDENTRKAQVSILASNELFASKVIPAGYGLKAVIKGEKTGKEITIEVSNAQLKEALENPMSPSEQLNAQIAQTRASLPMKVDQITTVTDIKLVGDDVVYVYEVDDETFDFSLISQNISKAKEGLRMQIEAANASTSILAPFFKLIRRAGKNLCYIYVSKTTGQQIKIKFTNSELQDIANNY